MKISILGGGAWGLAIASVLASNTSEDLEVFVYCRDPDISNLATVSRTHPRLPKVHLASNIQFSSDLFGILDGAECLFLTVPAQAYRGLLYELSKINSHGELKLVVCSKGIEHNTSLLMSEVVEDVLSDSDIQYQLAVLAGPHFAHEVAFELPTTALIASHSTEFAMQLVNLMSREWLSVSDSNDIIGAQLCGAVKNVIAVAVGIARGLLLGENAYASILQRSFAEMQALVEIVGGDVKTTLSPAGIGDLVLACGSMTSRNVRFGYDLIKTTSKQHSALSEGKATAFSLYNLATRHQLVMPICKAVYEVLYNDASPTEIAKAFLEWKS